jgi:hypothetical protein
MIIASFIAGIALMANGKEEGSYLRDITSDYQTGHLDWAPKLAGGGVNTLFIVNRAAGRNVAEICQRLDTVLTAVTTYNEAGFVRIGALAREDAYESSIEGTTIHEKTTELMRKLDGDYELFVMWDFAFDSLPPEAQFKILSKISQGAGLILMSEKTKLKKLFSSPFPEGAEWILSLAPLAGFPKSIKAMPPDKLLNTFSFGKGRIVTLDQSSIAAANPYSGSWASTYEADMVLVMRAMLWAARRVSGVQLSCPVLKNSPELDWQPQSFEIDVSGSNGGSLKARLRNGHNKLLAEKIFPLDASGKSKLNFEAGVLPAGKYFLDVTADNDNSDGHLGFLDDLWQIFSKKGTFIDNFGYFCFTVRSPVGAMSVDTFGGQESFKPGSKIDATLTLEKPLTAEGMLEVALLDSPYGREWFRKTVAVPPGSDKVGFALEDYHVPTIAGILRCRLSSLGKEVVVCEKLLFFPRRHRDLYTQLGWDTIPGGSLTPFHAGQIVDRLGFNHGLSWTDTEGKNARLAAVFNQRFVPYTTRILLGPDILKEKLKDGITDRSFYNPKIQKSLVNSIEATIKDFLNYGPAIYSLGDENGFQYCDEFSESGDKHFKESLRKRYRNDITFLNSVWGTNFKSFDDVKMTFKEAQERKIYPAWFDLRQHWEQQYGDMHHFYAAEIKKRDPDALVGAEGSVPGDLEYTIDGLEFWGPYSDPVMNEVLRSIGPDRIRMHWWGGYTGGMSGGRAEYPWPLWRPLLAGTVNGNAWYSTIAAGSLGMLGTDMRFADYFKHMLPYLDDLKNGCAQLLITTPMRSDGVAVLWSHASDSAKLLDPRFVNPKDSMGVFLDFCYATGINFDFLTSSMLAGKLDNYKILFLFGASSISETDAAQLKSFVEKGGTVVADINPGLLDGFLKPASRNMLEPLFGNLAYAEIKVPELAAIKVDTSLNGQILKFSAEKALTTPGLPLVRIQKLGKGTAILLNFSFSSARDTACGGTSFKQFLLSILAAENIKPYATLASIAPGGRMIRIRQGNGFTLVGLLCNKDELGKTVELSVPQTAYVYEVGRGLVGHESSWSFKLDSPFKLFTLYDKEQSKPEFSLGSGSASPGNVLNADISKIPCGTVLFVQIIGTDGNSLPMRDQVIVADDKTKSFDIIFAYGDKPGRYTVRAKSINTGLVADVEVELK